jgi:hypothetical protein
MHSGTENKKRAAKLVPCWEGPYELIWENNDCSTVTLKLAQGDKSFPTFHALLVKPYKENDDSLFPDCAVVPPDLVEVEGKLEHFVDRIVDHKHQRNGYHYLVRWQGESPANDLWIHESYLEDNKAVDKYWVAQSR